MLPFLKGILMGRFTSVFLFALILLAATGCRVDELSPCEGDIGIPGLLCKEYRFLEEEPIGSLSYFYDKNGILTRVDYNAVDGELKKYILYIYDGDKLMKEISHKPNGEQIQEVTFNYNENNSLLGIDSTESSGQVSRKTFEYENEVLRRESEYRQEVLTNYANYQYFDDGTLFKKLYHKGNGSLTGYTTYEFYSNSITRYKHYTASHIYLGYDAEHRNADDKITEFTSYNPAFEILSTTKYTYDELNQLEEKVEYDENGKVIAKYVYKYY